MGTPPPTDQDVESEGLVRRGGQQKEADYEKEQFERHKAKTGCVAASGDKVVEGKKHPTCGRNFRYESKDQSNSDDCFAEGNQLPEERLVWDHNMFEKCTKWRSGSRQTDLTAKTQVCRRPNLVRASMRRMRARVVRRRCAAPPSP